MLYGSACPLQDDQCLSAEEIDALCTYCSRKKKYRQLTMLRYNASAHTEKNICDLLILGALVVIKHLINNARIIWFSLVRHKYLGKFVQSIDQRRSSKATLQVNGIFHTCYNISP